MNYSFFCRRIKQYRCSPYREGKEIYTARLPLRKERYDDQETFSEGW